MKKTKFIIMGASISTFVPLTLFQPHVAKILKKNTSKKPIESHL